jgi:hypothetical protein
MSEVAAALQIVVAIIRLVDRFQGWKATLDFLKQVNDSFDVLTTSKTPEDKQNAAQKLSDLISGASPSK